MMEQKLSCQNYELLPCEFKKFSVAQLIGQKEVDPDLICSICFNLHLNPLECKHCRANFCTGCIQQTQACPNNCENPSFSEPHPFFMKYLQNVKVQCYRCQEVFHYGDAQLHFTECPERLLKCLSCQEEVKFRDRKEHIQDCLYFNCEKCEAQRTEKIGHDCIKYLKAQLKNTKLDYQCRMQAERKKYKKLQTAYQLLNKRMKSGNAIDTPNNFRVAVDRSHHLRNSSNDSLSRRSSLPQNMQYSDILTRSSTPTFSTIYRKETPKSIYELETAASLGRDNILIERCFKF